MTAKRDSNGRTGLLRTIAGEEVGRSASGSGEQHTRGHTLASACTIPVPASSDVAKI